MRLKIILTALILGISGHTYSCKCNGNGTVKEAFENADLIIHGKVLSQQLISFAKTIKDDKVNEVKEGLKGDQQKLRFFEMGYIYEVKLEVIEKYKGESHLDTATIYTTMNSASCGYKFDNGKTYIIYGSKKCYINSMFVAEADRSKNLERVNTYWTSHCTRTTQYNKPEADELITIKKKSG